eukprot:7403472-Ditylum_brightwellii.AAC.1
MQKKVVDICPRVVYPAVDQQFSSFPIKLEELALFHPISLKCYCSTIGPSIFYGAGSKPVEASTPGL